MRYMRPIIVSTTVPQDREAVYEYLAVLADHEQFTDHMMRDWRPGGPRRGVGARAAVQAVLGGRREPVDIEVIEDEAPVKSVERNTGAGGKRVATGTYALDPLPDGGTRITFRYTWEQIPLGERIAAPLVRRVMRKGLETAMHRLAEQLHANRKESKPDPAT